MTKFKYIELIDHVGGECECCGGYYGSGKQVYVNDVLVWETSSDGHMSGFTTKGNLVDLVIAEWGACLLGIYNKQSTEEARIEWNKKYVGNTIASTSAAWAEYHREQKEYCIQYISNVVDRCSMSNMPYSEWLCLKMIAIWIENETNEIIEVEYEYEERNYE